MYSILSLNVFHVLIISILANESRNKSVDERINPLLIEKNVVESRFKSSKKGYLVFIPF